MEQLKMKRAAYMPEELPLPEGITVRRMNDSEYDKQVWLEICRCGILPEEDDGKDYYKMLLTDYPDCRLEDVFFFMRDGKEVGTIAGVLHPEKRDGWVHMVAVRPEARGMRIGKLMLNRVMRYLASRGAETFNLSTDDFRLPAIKRYLDAGFEPNYYAEGMQERWEKVLRSLGR